MREFFGDWKRKLGVVTLVMACVLTAGWVRSAGTIDLILLDTQMHHFNLVSGCGHFQFVAGRLASQTVSRIESVEIPTQISMEMEFDQNVIRSALPTGVKHLRYDATEMAIYSISGDVSTPIMTVPYWSIVLPLTLLSAWLLLSKPRPVKRVTPPVNIAN